MTQFIGFLTKEPLSKKEIPLSGVNGVKGIFEEAAVGKPFYPLFKLYNGFSKCAI